VGCVVFGNNNVNGIYNAGSWTAFASFFDSITSPTPYPGHPGFYPAPVAINVHVSGNTDQPVLQVTPTASTIAQGAKETLTFSIAGLQSPSLNTYKTIYVYFEVGGTDQTADLISGAILTSVSLADQKTDLGGTYYAVKIPGSGQNSATVTLNTADVNSNSLSISLIHYDGTSRETNGHTIVYNPSKQPMLSGSAPATITLIPHTADVQNGQTFDVAANQALNRILDRPGGVVNVKLGGSVSDTLVYGNLNILPGGFADPTTIYEGGIEVVSSGGTDLGAQIWGGEQDVFGYVSGVTIYAGIEVVESGGTSDNTVVSSGGTLELLGGAFASMFTIGSGGTLVVASGYLLSGYEVASGVTLEVAAGGTAIATIVDNGATLELLGGGVANGFSINTGAMLAVASGYNVSSYDVLSGITLEVAAGGTATLTTVESGGTLVLLGGAVADNSTVSSGGTLEVASGYVLTGSQISNGVALVIASGGTEIVTSGTTDIGRQISGGEQIVFGYAEGAIVYLGSQVVESGGVTSGSIIAGGVQVVSANGTDFVAQISGGEQDVFGIANGAIIFAGVEIVEAGGVASGTIVSDGIETISASGTDLAAQIVGGEQDVLGYAGGATLFVGLQGKRGRHGKWDNN
jgi:autotransporter passenger strand-loop-strand repeat protein